MRGEQRVGQKGTQGGTEGTECSPPYRRQTRLRSRARFEHAIKTDLPAFWRQELDVQPITALAVGDHKLPPYGFALEQIDQPHGRCIGLFEQPLAVEPRVF